MKTIYVSNVADTIDNIPHCSQLDVCLGNNIYRIETTLTEARELAHDRGTRRSMYDCLDGSRREDLMYKF